MGCATTSFFFLTVLAQQGYWLQYHYLRGIVSLAVGIIPLSIPLLLPRIQPKQNEAQIDNFQINNVKINTNAAIMNEKKNYKNVN